MQEVPQTVKELQGILWYGVAIARFQSLAHPTRPMHVPQAARSFFDIGFQLIDRVTELLITSRLHVREQLDEAVPILLNQARHDLAFELQRRFRIT